MGKSLMESYSHILDGTVVGIRITRSFSIERYGMLAQLGAGVMKILMNTLEWITAAWARVLDASTWAELLGIQRASVCYRSSCYGMGWARY